MMFAASFVVSYIRSLRTAMLDCRTSRSSAGFLGDKFSQNRAQVAVMKNDEIRGI